MSIPILIVDAFVTDRPFTGNPAAVCILPPGGCDEPGVESRFQDIAAEMNLSETAFVAPIANAGSSSEGNWGHPPINWKLEENWGHPPIETS